MIMNGTDLRRVDLNLLVVFETLMAERHVGRAAQRLNMTQSAVSHALARLRGLFDDQLFARHPTGIAPTRRSLALGPQVTDILNRARSVLTPGLVFDPARPHRFRIGQTDGSIPFLVPLVERLRRDAPNMTLQVLRIDADGIVAALDRQEIDLGLAVMPSTRPVARIVRVPVLNIRYVGIARAGHPAVRNAPRKKEEFASLPHLAVSPRGEPTSRVDELLAEAGLRRNIVVTVPHFLAAPLIIARTDLVAIIDASIAQLFVNNRSLTIFELPVKLRPIAVDLVAARSRSGEDALNWLRQQCVDLSLEIVQQRSRGSTESGS
jgi:DNA-binding transcriptional LysR family regulator